MAATLSLHRRHRNLGREEDASTLVAITLPIHLFGDGCNRARAPDACIVDQSIDATEAIERRLNHLSGNDGSPMSPATVM